MRQPVAHHSTSRQSILVPLKKTALDFPLKQTSPASILGGMRDLGRVAEIQVKRSALPPYLLFWRDVYSGCAATNR